MLNVFTATFLCYCITWVLSTLTGYNLHKWNKNTQLGEHLDKLRRSFVVARIQYTAGLTVTLVYSLSYGNAKPELLTLLYILVALILSIEVGYLAYKCRLAHQILGQFDNIASSCYKPRLRYAKDHCWVQYKTHRNTDPIRTAMDFDHRTTRITIHTKLKTEFDYSTPYEKAIKFIKKHIKKTN